MTVEMNPLLDFSVLPRFDGIRPAHVTPAIDTLLADARAIVDRVATDPRSASWATVVEPLADVLDHLERAWGVVAHLNSVVNTTELRDAYHGNLPKVTAFHAELAQDLRLYAKYRDLASAPSFASLEPPQRRSIENELRDFKLGGAELPIEEKARFKEIQEELANVCAEFDDHVLDATNAWVHYVPSEDLLAGVPADVICEARAAATAEGKSGYKLTLRMPCYLPILQYAENRELRKMMHRADATRASELGAQPEWDNGPLIDRILALRQEEARLLGFPSFADVSLVPKMARSPAEVLAFLRDLGACAKPYAERDYTELAAFARDELLLSDFLPWDFAFATEKLKAKRFGFSEQELKQYFPENRVLAGLFRVVETIYDVQIREGSAAVWHPTVRFFEISDRAGTLVGQFYFDLYARECKQGGAWMGDAINRRRVDGGIQHPVAYMICNLPAPVVEGESTRPACFTHDDVITLFHEFGHGLHQLLTRVDVAGVSGIQGVEWDAVELPSQFMENFCWEWDVLKHMTEHVGSKAPLPRELFDKMLAAKNFQSGLATVRQLEFGVFDMLLHAQYDPVARKPWESPQALLDVVRREIAVFSRPDYDRFMQAFGHIFAGGYAAGYYSYKWAEVLSADAYSLFEEDGVLSPTAGARFRDEVLARGGSRPALESFVAFRGRAPQLDALLRHNGMVAA